MKKLLLAVLALAVFKANAAEDDSVTLKQVGPNLIVEVVGARTDKGVPYAGGFISAKQKITRRLSIAEIGFSEYEIDFHQSGKKAFVDSSSLLILGVGLVYTGKNFNVGVMPSYVNSSPHYGVTISGYVQSNNDLFSGYSFVTVQREKVEFVFEGIGCFDIPRTNLKIGAGAITFKQSLGPYLRISSKNFYFGVSYGWNFLPEIAWGEEKSHHDVATKAHTGEGVFSGVLGLEFCPRCR